MHDQSSVYVFRHPAFASAGDTVVCAAPLDLVVSVYGGGGIKGEGGLVAAFGGAAFFRDEDGSSYLAVWGARNASRFRSALRIHVTLNVVRASPSARLVFYKTRNTRPNRRK
jgi:hypothetical protein